MKLNKFAYGNHTLNIMKKYLEIYLKTWKYHGILSVRKSGNPVASSYITLILIAGEGSAFG